METLDAIYSRRSIRQFVTKKIPDEMIRKLLKAAMHAPSGYNQQLWQFVLIRKIRPKRTIIPPNKFPSDMFGMPCVTALIPTESSGRDVKNPSANPRKNIFIPSRSPILLMFITTISAAFPKI